MKKLILLIISLFWIGMSFAQVRPIEDSRELKKFKKYVNSILNQKKDTLSLDTIPKKYRIIYSTSCSYIEYWMGNDGCAYGTQGESFINQAASTIDTLSTDAMFAQIKKLISVQKTQLPTLTWKRFLS